MTPPGHQSATASLQTDLQIQGGSHLKSQSSNLVWVLVLLPLGFLWFRLIDNLRLEWTTNPQYGYGSLVPFLCFGLLLRRWQGFALTETRSSTLKLAPLTFLFSALALIYLPTRLIEGAVPEWRPVQWLLGVETIGLTLSVIWLAKGREWLRQLAFPIVFFFVAIPWPSTLEIPIIQGLTQISAVIVTELLGLVGVPAMVHGNLIEVGTGLVGIDEACSGIRSFQSSLMISLFLGEFYALSASSRWLLVPIGFALSMGLNVGRMFLLTLVAAEKGVNAISQYHDPAGITIAITCTLALWGLAVLLKKQSKKITDKSLSTTNETSSPPSILQAWESNVVILNRFAVTLIIWLVMVEVGVELWYRHLESRIKAGPEWSLNFPQDKPTFKELPVSPDSRYLLRFDDGKQAAWTEPDGTKWQAYYFNWLPGRVAGYLAKRHTPEICLQATGRKMLAGPKLTVLTVNEVELPVRSYIFETAGMPLHVFHCRWEAGVGSNAYVEQESARFNLVRGVWAGRSTHGQKVVEIIVAGYADAEKAQVAVARQLENMVKVSKPTNRVQTALSAGPISTL